MWVYGLHAVAALLARTEAPVHELLALEGRQDQRLRPLLVRAVARGVRVSFCPRQRLDELTDGARHQGVAARTEAAAPMDEHSLLAAVRSVPDPLLLVLDGVQDPHNLGACLRSAEAAGVLAVIAPRDHSAPLSPVARKAACGAAERLPYVTVANLARTFRALKEAGIWLLGADAGAPQAHTQAVLTGPLAIVLGGEGAGLRRLTLDACDFTAHIPMLGAAESLNVSVAAGVFLFEARRQRAGS
jgi:23S rRNA (guanosine2251-2'-O)-methyltransferase